MAIIIFDLDDTILPSDSYVTYNDIKKNKKLLKLFEKLSKCNYIYIYTNGTYSHANTSLQKLNIRKYIDGVFARDTIPYMKPDFKSFQYVNNIIRQIHGHDVSILFLDDMIDNCRVAKLFGWNVFLINPYHNKYKFGYNIGYSNIFDVFN